MDNIFFISTDHNMDTVIKNLKRSPIITDKNLVLAKDEKNVPKSYNMATAILGGALSFMMAEAIIYVHEDVYMPDTFEEELKRSLKYLKGSDWGVLGVAGARYDNGKTTHGFINDRGRKWGKPILEPVKVQTVDELMIIVNPEADLSFDEQFPLDFYGADICMQANERGLGVYVIPGYLDHNSSRPFGGRTPSFYESQAKFTNKWINHLPIATTCANITKAG